MSSSPTDRPTLHDRRGASTLWRAVAERIEQDIRSFRYKPGERLPTEFELAEIFNVHRNTIRRAMNVLRERNLLRIEQGRGTFVKERMVRHTLGPKTRLTAALRDIDRLGERRFIGSSRIRVTEDIAKALRVARNRFVRKVDTLTVVDGFVVSMSSSFFPLPRFEGIEALIEETGSFSQSWQRLGVADYQRREAHITAVALPREDAEILSMARGQPAIFITNINVDMDDIPIVVSYTRIAPQHMQLVVRFD
ncbi:phosphonate metabolism transcriptional regulator PhnF [Rhizobium miluonense]|uniref:GntR family transcriptional regulator, phosphonate transport system regulatory protein n=1 Tax=Rhizobium miluonense TaxID=411945 RepID=A0A1C3WED3_9HYPH|nr:phosphonate metabolism transcriptional regulator PhnF [Rhizobium miluonense]SCB38255.1 GntR family transcriptional regulator, phosphonate transport system regulatory protein [Rhizobium miluonense]